MGRIESRRAFIHGVNHDYRRPDRLGARQRAAQRVRQKDCAQPLSCLSFAIASRPISVALTIG